MNEQTIKLYYKIIKNSFKMRTKLRKTSGKVIIKNNSNIIN